MTPGQLARAEHVQPPSMTKVIESLEARGMLRREPHPSDGRQYLVSRTAAAEEFVIASRKVRTAWLADHLARLSDADRQAIAAAAPALNLMTSSPLTRPPGNERRPSPRYGCGTTGCSSPARCCRTPAPGCSA